MEQVIWCLKGQTQSQQQVIGSPEAIRELYTLLTLCNCEFEFLEIWDLEGNFLKKLE